MISSHNKPTIAFLLMVHENPEQINQFLRQLLAYEHSEIYIHVDINQDHIKSLLLPNDRIHILEKSIHGKWGDYAQIEMIDMLLRYAYEHGSHDYYSLHSGCDLAIRPVNEYADYLAKMQRYAFYYGPKLPRKDWGSFVFLSYKNHIIFHSFVSIECVLFHLFSIIHGSCFAP